MVFVIGVLVSEKLERSRWRRACWLFCHIDVWIRRRASRDVYRGLGIQKRDLAHIVKRVWIWICSRGRIASQLRAKINFVKERYSGGSCRLRRNLLFAEHGERG